MTIAPTRGLRVLHVSVAASLFPLFRWELLLAQRQRGYVVEIATPAEARFHRHIEQIRAAGFTMHDIPMVNGLRPISNLRSVIGLARLIRRERYDVVHTHQPMGAVLGATAARLAGARVVLYSTGGFKTHEGLRGPVRWLVRTGERALLALTTAVFSVNREDVANGPRMGIVPADKIHYVGARGGCGIDTARFSHLPLAERRAAALRREFGLGPEHQVIGLVGRYVWEKGFREAFGAVAALAPRWPALRLLCVGYGPDEASIRQWAEAHGASERVVFTGDRSDVPALLNALDLFILPSYREGMPVSLLEAMAAGLPVIASHVRGSREAIQDGVTGLLIPPRQTPPLADAIERLLADEALAERLGVAAREFVAREHAVDVLLPKVMDLYEQIVARAGIS